MWIYYYLWILVDEDKEKPELGSSDFILLGIVYFSLSKFVENTRDISTPLRSARYKGCLWILGGP
mgnify:CR=1 FL=1